VQLTIQAAALGQGGEVFVLDMGEPIRVVELATELIRLSGLEPGRDIEVVFTGLRPGEKLHEVLFAEGEQPRPTAHEKILVACRGNAWDSQSLSHHLQQLERLAHEGHPARIRAKIQEIVPECRWPADVAPGLMQREHRPGAAPADAAGPARLPLSPRTMP